MVPSPCKDVPPPDTPDDEVLGCDGFDIFKFENFPGGFLGITLYWGFCEGGDLYYGYTISDCYEGDF